MIRTNPRMTAHASCAVPGSGSVCWGQRFRSGSNKGDSVNWDGTAAPAKRAPYPTVEGTRTVLKFVAEKSRVASVKAERIVDLSWLKTR